MSDLPTPPATRRPSRAGLPIVGLGIVLCVYQYTKSADPGLPAALLAIWAFAPYVVIVVANLFLRGAGPMFWAGAPTLALHAWGLRELLLAPGSSPAPAPPVLLPLWTLLFVVPLGLGFGTLVQRTGRKLRGTGPPV